jgi:hypothetical protein
MTKHHANHLLLELAILTIAIGVPGLEAREIQADPDTYRKALSQLQAGDSLILAPGTYARGLPLTDRHGTPEHWITVCGPADGSAIIQQQAEANCVELWNCNHVTIQSLTLQGSGRGGQFGISAKGGAHNRVHDIRIEDCVISDWNSGQQAVGISTKTPTWGWIIRHNIIRRCGTGLYLGNSNGEEPFIQGIIEHNLIHDPIGYCMEIKFQKQRAPVEGMPTEPGSTVIRHNVFVKSDAPSPDEDRPHLLVGGFPQEGLGAEDRYEIYGNLFFHNPRESMLQASGRVSIHDNVFVDCPRPEYAAITLRDHDLPLRLAHVYRNTICQTARGIRIATVPDQGYAVVGNLMFAEQPLVLQSGVKPTNNLTFPSSEASQYLTAVGDGIVDLDLHPRSSPNPRPALNLTPFANDIGFDRDFDGILEHTAVRYGAYSSLGSAQSWKPSLTRKPRP